MRHRVAGYKLGRNSAQRLALRRNLVTELFRHDRITTTEAKAKSMRNEAEHLITVAKRSLAAGGDRVQHAQRLAAAVFTDPVVTKRLFSDIASLFTERPGGYTRLRKLGPRLGDGAEMVVLELVDKPVEEPKAKK